MAEIEYVLDVMYGGPTPHTRRFAINERAYDALKNHVWEREPKQTLVTWKMVCADGSILVIDLSLSEGIKVYTRIKSPRNEDDKPLNPDLSNPLARNEALYDDPLN